MTKSNQEFSAGKLFPSERISRHTELHERGEPIDPPIRCDVLLAADCVYLESSFPLLVDTLVQLAGPDTLVLLSYKKRRKSVALLPQEDQLKADLLLALLQLTSGSSPSSKSISPGKKSTTPARRRIAGKAFSYIGLPSDNQRGSESVLIPTKKLQLWQMLLCLILERKLEGQVRLHMSVDKGLGFVEVCLNAAKVVGSGIFA